MSPSSTVWTIRAPHRAGGMQPRTYELLERYDLSEGMVAGGRWGMRYEFYRHVASGPVVEAADPAEQWLREKMGLRAT